VICTRDRADLIGQAVTSVVDCDHDGIDLHVMDQSTDDGTERVVSALGAQHSERTTIVYHHLEVAGLSRAYNAAFQATTSQVVACTDDDVIVHRDWIRTIERAFAADDRLGALYGQVICPESLRDVGPEMIVPALTWTERQRLFHADRNYKVWGMGANMAIRRKAFDAIGGFDELMGGGAPLRSSQDYDFSLRMYRRGWAVLLDPEVRVDHYGARRADQWSATEHAYGIGDGAFYGKHVRCRDLMALRMLLKVMSQCVAKSAYHSIRQRKVVPLSVYTKSLVKGLRDGARFDVDRDQRLYVENARARFEVSEANAVAGTDPRR
jgi:GT2 family glycosyltransferase